MSEALCNDGLSVINKLTMGSNEYYPMSNDSVTNTAFFIAQKLFYQNLHFIHFSQIIIYLTSGEHDQGFPKRFFERVTLIKQTFSLIFEPMRTLPWITTSVIAFNAYLQKSIDTFAEKLLEIIQQTTIPPDLVELFNLWNQILDEHYGELFCVLFSPFPLVKESAL